MYPPCISVNEYLIPETRKRIAKTLKRNGISEKEIAKKLHISQGMVSRYIHQKNSSFLDDDIDFVSNELANRMIENYSEKDTTEFFCDFCIRIREKGKFCQMHRIENCDLCFYFYNPRKNDAKINVILQLSSSLKKLSSLPIEDLVPEVRINIAYAVENPKSIMDIAAFPGRLTYAKDELIAYGEPEFGASRHLSNILLAANKIDKNKRAIINIKFNNEILEKLEKNGNKVRLMDRNKYRDVIDFIDDLKDEYDVVADPGSFGIEPVVYIFGKDPDELFEKIRKIFNRKMEV